MWRTRGYHISGTSSAAVAELSGELRADLKAVTRFWSTLLAKLQRFTNNWIICLRSSCKKRRVKTEEVIMRLRYLVD